MSGAGLMAGARPCAVTRAGQPGGMAKKKTTTPDERAGRVAQQHHGLITAAQALRCGISSTEVSRRVARGRWQRLARGVYRIVGAPETAEQPTFRSEEHTSELQSL